MTKPIDVEVLVVGAGPTGLVLAAELWRRGITCRIIDSLAQPSDKSRALAIHARTLEVFDMIGVVDEFLKAGWRSQAFTVFDRKKQIVRMTFEQTDCRFPFVLSLPQFETERILAEHALTKRGVIERGTTLLSMKQDLEAVESEVEHLDGTRETIFSNWLIGCDGAHSFVRRLLNQPFKGNFYFEQYVLADVEFETTLDTSDHYLFSGDRGVAGFHGFSETHARIFADVSKISRRGNNKTDPAQADAQQFPEPSHEELQTILDERGPGNVQLTKLNWVSMHRIHRRQVDSYRTGRVFLAGDAAHVHSPASGQGMNLGIQDAYNLAWKLALVQRKAASDNLLDGYSLERHLVGRQVSAMSDFFTRINEVRSPLLQAIRNHVGPVLARQEPIRHRYRRAVAGLSANYRLSPLVREQVRSDGLEQNPINTAPHAGDRAPDGIAFGAEDGSSVRLFELFRDERHHLLLFSGRANVSPLGSDREFHTILQQLETEYKDLVNPHLILQTENDMPALRFDGSTLFDPDLSLHKTYGAERACIYLVRPDGYVAFRALPVDSAALEEFLMTAFRPGRLHQSFTLAP